MIKTFGKSGFLIFHEEDLKYLKPAIMIVFAGVFLFYLSLLYLNSKKVNYFKKELSNIKEKTRGIEREVYRIDNLRRKVEFVHDNIEKHPSQLSIFLELQRNFPPETHLLRYSFNRNKIEVQGTTPKSSELISQLSSSVYFTDIKFTSPVEKDREPGKERFSVAINLKE